MVILTHFVTKHELAPLARYLTLEDILKGSAKVLKGLGIPTKPPSAIPGLQFYKVRIGKMQSARMIVFVLLNNKKIVPLLIRLKKDKIFGNNMALNNPLVVKELNKNLDAVLSDITNKKYEEFAV
ncbi:MAG: hypothetical protein Q7K39_03745 [Candidatus Magasanikbacteria bacterium]|nr:hypothetical protein [Candidatus Magasanikbacteria bacterium]